MAPVTTHLTGDSATSSSFGLFFTLPLPSWPHLLAPNAYASPLAATTTVWPCGREARAAIRGEQAEARATRYAKGRV
jgi:hypothetical protein